MVTQCPLFQLDRLERFGCLTLPEQETYYGG
jgi:hypothetical protein